MQGLIAGVRRKEVRVVSRVPQGSVIGPFLLIHYMGDLSVILENTHVSCTDTSTFSAEVSIPVLDCQSHLLLILPLIAFLIG
mgnify:CR=1 FL=1